MKLRRIQMMTVVAALLAASPIATAGTKKVPRTCKGCADRNFSARTVSGGGDESDSAVQANRSVFRDITENATILYTDVVTDTNIPKELHAEGKDLVYKIQDAYEALLLKYDGSTSINDTTIMQDQLSLSALSFELQLVLDKVPVGDRQNMIDIYKNIYLGNEQATREKLGEMDDTSWQKLWTLLQDICGKC